MKTICRAAFAFLVVALSVGSIRAEDQHESYISYRSGEISVVQAYDGRRIEGQVNLPIFAGDDVQVHSRSRAEIRLADGSVLGLDQDTVVRFHDLSSSYDGDSDQTVIELFEGAAMVRNRSEGGDPLRVDTRNATYLSLDDAIYGIESSGSSRDLIAVFGGSIEIRTRRGTTRLRAGERGQVDREGLVDSHGLARGGMNDFQRWFLRRSDRYQEVSGRYLDGRLGYASADLDAYGSWVYVHDYGNWVWRPRVSVGWRPYYHGRWAHGRSGALVWVSDEPWGWVPYHYGRWTYSSIYGWIWLPGYSYSPAWVYWMYGPSYIGWVPAGWYDCYRPYYSWLYRPRIDVRFGFWGRVRLSHGDLAGWTFVNPSRIISHRVDRAAVATDSIRDRLARDGLTATLSNTPARFTRRQLEDPDAAVRAIARRGAGGGTGKEGEGSLSDVTDFFRRDPELSSSTRQRLVRSSAGGESTRDAGLGRSSGTSGVARGTDRATDSATRTRPSVGGGAAGSSAVRSRPAAVDRPAAAPVRDGAVESRQPSRSRGSSTPTSQPAAPSPQPDQSWRGRSVNRDSATSSRSRPMVRPAAPSSDSSSEKATESDTSRDDSWRSAPVPRRIIDSIGGARVVAPERGDEGSSGTTPRARPSSSSREGSSTTRERPSTSSGSDSPPSSSRSSGAIRTPRVERPSSSSSSSVRVPAPRPSSSAGSGSSRESSGSAVRARPTSSSRSSSAGSRSSNSSDSTRARPSSSGSSSKSSPRRVNRSGKSGSDGESDR